MAVLSRFRTGDDRLEFCRPTCGCQRAFTVVSDNAVPSAVDMPHRGWTRRVPSWCCMPSPGCPHAHIVDVRGLPPTCWLCWCPTRGPEYVHVRTACCAGPSVSMASRHPCAVLFVALYCNLLLTVIHARRCPARSWTFGINSASCCMCVSPRVVVTVATY